MNCYRAVAAGILAGMPIWAQDIPELEAIPAKASAHPNEAFAVTYEVRWSGDPGEFAVMAPEIESFDWGTATVGPVTATTRDGQNVVAHSISFVAKQSGDFETPGVNIAYFHPEAAPPTETPNPETDPPGPGAYPSLRASPFPIMVRPDRTALWFSGGLGALLLLTVLSIYAVRRPRKPITVALAGPIYDLENIRVIVHNGTQRRLDGQYYEYFVELARAASMMPPNDETAKLRAGLESTAKQAGYGGKRPTDDDMDGALRDVERVLSKLRNT